MKDGINWIPPLILMADFDYSWPAYIDAAYARFRADFVESKPKLQGLEVTCAAHPFYDGKESGFWHCVQEGKIEDERIPDLRRCERVGWIRAIIENSSDHCIDRWSNDRRSERRHYLWFHEEFLVVIADRKRYWRLITAFPTARAHSVEKLRKERDESKS